MVALGILDLVLIYFFSISFTQLLKTIDAAAIEKLRWFTKFGTIAISIAIFGSYYPPLKPLLQAQRESEKSTY